MLWFVPAERWKIKVPSLIQTLIQSFPPTSLKGSLEAWVKILLPHWTKWPNNSRASFGNTKETAAETSFVLPPAWDRSSERSLWSQKINTPITSVISGSKNHRKRLEQIVPTAVSTCNLHLTLVQMWGRAAHIQHCSYRKVSSEEVRILQKQDWFQSFFARTSITVDGKAAWKTALLMTVSFKKHHTCLFLLAQDQAWQL